MTTSCIGIENKEDMDRGYGKSEGCIDVCLVSADLKKEERNAFVYFVR
jgi:hypothetical protein